MPAIFFIMLVTMIMSIMAAIISGMTSSSSQLNQMYVAETRKYFEDISKVVINDITPQNMHANPSNTYKTIATYINGMPQIKQLSFGRTNDAATDAWGRALKGHIFTANQVLITGITVPVTGIALISAGPDGVFQTTVPTTVTSLNNVSSISAPSGSDDIVLTFNNRRAQEDILATSQAAMRRIGTAAVKELQGRLATHRETRLKQYQAKIKDGEAVSISMLDLATDTGAPVFLKLDETSTAGKKNRRQLGVDGDFDFLERKVGTGKMMVEASAPSRATDPLILTLKNGSPASPWPTVNYKLHVTAIE